VSFTFAVHRTFIRNVAFLAMLAFSFSGLRLSERVDAQSPAGQRSLPDSAILRGEAHAAMMQRLRVVRRYTLADLRTNPHVLLGESKHDFTPMLNNPKALFNITARLRTMPQNVEVKEDTSEISEVAQGLVIHHVLTYRILPGKCADSGARAQFVRLGIGCFTRSTMDARMAEFSRPGSPRYVADEGKRQAAIATYRQNAPLAQADVARQIANLRKTLADQGQRAQIVMAVGAAEVARMDRMNDDQLTEEVINAAVQRVEQTMFVPRLESSKYVHLASRLRITPSAEEIAAGKQLLHMAAPANGATNPSFPKLIRVVTPGTINYPVGGPKVVVPGTINHTLGGSGSNAANRGTTDIDLGTFIYLTGFTLSHDYEWHQEVDLTINWCLVGCSHTYFIKVYAGFNYAFGLRFPIQTQLAYHNSVHPDLTHTNVVADASLIANFLPIDGSAAQFASTGLEGDQIFDGKELVAQFGADAGFSYDVPVYGSQSFGVSPEVDLTTLLPPPYKGGNFTPPAPGTHGIDTNYTFDMLDLLGGTLDYGVVAGQVFPAVKINLHSNKLQFTLNDEVWNKQTNVTVTGQPVPLGTDPNQNYDSHFSFGNPVYNLGFTLTPGIDARLTVSVAVWSHNWDWPVWFPDASIDLPPNGVDFACHAGTNCILDFKPETVAGVAGTQQQGGCVQQQGNEFLCYDYTSYQNCLNSATPFQKQWGIQPQCTPSQTLKGQFFVDKTLTGGGCQRIAGQFGNYLCSIKSGMFDACNGFKKNGGAAVCMPLP
jgi:hypothetical protein